MSKGFGSALSQFGMAACTAIAVLGGTSAFAGTLTISDTTSGQPIYNRPLAGNPPTGLSAVGTAVRYDVNAFTVSALGNYVFQSTGNFDNFSFLYQNSFNPAAPLTNVLVGNDDNPIIGLSGFTYALATGVTYFFVETGFANTDFGTYSLTITGPGTPSLVGPAAVPEPETLALLGIALAAMGLAARRRKT